MDNTSFPKMLDPKKKTLPNNQLLRWRDWFSKYKFTVRHLKGHHNTIADFLSRPQKAIPTIKSIFPEPCHPLYILTISEPSSSSQDFPESPPSSQESSTTETMPYTIKATIFPPQTHPKSRTEILHIANQNLFYWLHLLLIKTQIHPKPEYFNLNTPYITIPLIQGPIPEELLWYLWSLTTLYAGAIAISPLPIYHYLCDPKNAHSHLTQLFEMFAPTPYWRGKLFNIINGKNLWDIPKKKQKKFCCVFVLHRSYHLDTESNLYSDNQMSLWKTLVDWTTQEAQVLKDLGAYLAHLNMQYARNCTTLGPIPFENFDPYQEISPPESSYAYQASTSQIPLGPPGQYFQDSQDPYQDFTQQSQQPDPSLYFQTPLPQGLNLPQPTFSQSYPEYCSQMPPHEDYSQIPPKYYLNPLAYVRDQIGDEDNDNLSPDDDHEPICKD